MIKTTLGIEGMACSMCEAHVNDAVRRHFDVKSVKSSRRHKRCVIISDEPLDEGLVRGVISEVGYGLTSFESSEQRRRALFG